MKRLLILVLLFLCFAVNVKADVEESVITDFFVRDKKSKELFEFNFYNDGDVILYSTKFVPYLENDKFEYINDSYEEFYGIDIETWNHIKNIIYFGFQYQDHEDILWYALVQAMVYQELGLNYEVVDINNQNIFMSFRTEYMQLRSLVKKYENLPEIYESGSEIDINYQEGFLLDYNDLQKFDWSIEEGLFLLQVGTDLYLEGMYPTVSNLTWKSKAIDTNNIIYYNTDSQFITRGGPTIYGDKLVVNVHGSMLKIINDSDDGNLLANSMIKVLNSENNLVEKLMTNELGYAEIELSAGKYRVIQESVNSSYLLNDKEINIVLSDCETKEIKITNSKKIIANKNDEYLILDVPATGISIRPIFIIISIIALLIGLIFYVKEK